MKFVLSLLVLLALSSFSFAADSPSGLVSVPAVPFGTPLVQGSCPNGVCNRVTQFAQSIPAALGVNQAQASSGCSGGCESSGRRRLLFAPFGGKYRLFK